MEYENNDTRLKRKITELKTELAILNRDPYEPSLSVYTNDSQSMLVKIPRDKWSWNRKNHIVYYNRDTFI
jgi:hypothetical protein